MGEIINDGLLIIVMFENCNCFLLIFRFLRIVVTLRICIVFFK